MVDLAATGPGALSAPDRLARRASARPDEAALAVDGGASLTFAGWQQRADAAAAGLAARRVERGERLALVFDLADWDSLAVCWMAARTVGAAAVVLSPPLGALELGRVLDGCSAVGMVVAGGAAPPRQGGLSPWVATVDELEAAEPDRERPDVGGGAGELACISGVLAPPRFRWVADGEERDLPEPTGPGWLVHAFPVGSAAGRAALRRPLLHGAPVKALAQLDPDRFWSLVARHDVVSVGLPATAATVLADHRRPGRPAAVRQVLLPGGCPPASRGRLAGAFPGARLVSLEDPAASQEGPRAARSGSQVAPLAASQEGMVWLEQLVPGCQSMPPLARRFRGPLDVGALERALGDLVARQDALRTTFRASEGRARQVVSPPAGPELALRDLSSLDPDRRRSRIEAMIAEEAMAPVDLATGPLFRPTLVRLASDDHVLLIRVHHSVFDDWSVGPFRHDLAALYAAHKAGRSAALPPLEAGFANLARSQAERRDGPDGTRALEYWDGELAGAPVALQLPIHDPQAPPGASQGSAGPLRLELAASEAAAVRALARDRRVSPFMVALAAFCVAVRRSTGQDDLVLSTVVANRDRTEAEHLVGCFTKKVPLRVRVDGSESFGSLLGRVRTAVLGAMGHHGPAYETVVQRTLGPRAAVHGLVPTLGVVFQGETGQAQATDLPVAGLESTGLQTSATVRRGHFAAGEERPDPGRSPWGAGLYLGTFLILSMAEAGPLVTFEARGAFHPPAVSALLDSLRRLLDAAVTHPARPVGELGAPAWPGPSPRPPGAGVLDLAGFTIHRAPLEAALGRCPGVAEVVVDAVGEGEERRLVAHVVPGPGGLPPLADLRAAVWRELPGYAWPSAMVAHAALPRRPGGGLDRSALPEPTGAPPNPPASFEADLLTALWAETGEEGPIGSQESYWTRLAFLDAVSAARRLGVPVTLDQVARARTPEMLASVMAADRET